MSKKAPLRKPEKKTVWRGQKGNKFRVYILINHQGNRYSYNSKSNRDYNYDASMRFYKKVKNRK